MRSACLTLLAYAARHQQTANFADLPQLLTDPTFRARITADLGDPGRSRRVLVHLRSAR